MLQRSSSILFVAFFAATADTSAVIGGPVVVAVLALIAVLAVSAYEIARYRRFDYSFTEETLEIRSGVFGRRERELPYHRIQNVDVTRNVIPRLLGIAAVGFETAGGSHTEGSIRYVSAAEADRLQREIQRRKRQVKETEPSDDSVLETELFAITPSELALVGALSYDLRVVGVLTLLGPGSVPVLSGLFSTSPLVLSTMIGIVLAGVLLAAWLLGIAVAVINYYGFQLTSAGDEFRYERGLVRQYSGSIPHSKVQSITIEDNPLKRAFGYASLTVETAGYAPGSGAKGSQVVIPIARRDRVFSVARKIEPFGEPDLTRPPKRIRRRYIARYLLGLGLLTTAAVTVDTFVPVDLPWYGVGVLVPLVIPAAHLTWRHRGYWTGSDHVVTRGGFWNRSITIVPYYRIQTVIDSRTLFQRRWDVATVTIDTAGSRSLLGRDAAAVDVEIGDALDLGETLIDRLRESVANRRKQRLSSGSHAGPARDRCP